MENYVHGSDLLLGIETAGTGSTVVFTPLGFSKSCSVKYSTETKERMHKNQSNSSKQWADKSVSKLSCSISAEGFFASDGSTIENAYETLEEKWLAGEKVVLKWGERATSGVTNAKKGTFVITSLELSGPADDDATWSASFENSGAITTVTNSSQL